MNSFTHPTPGAAVLRVETDYDGIYEAHLTTTDGQRVTVEVDKACKVTGEESAPGRPEPRRTQKRSSHDRQRPDPRRSGL
jgi:hypothetical protein